MTGLAVALAGIPGVAGGEGGAQPGKDEPPIPPLVQPQLVNEPIFSLPNEDTNEGKLQIIFKTCPDYWHLVWAIGRHESGNWQHSPGGHNYFGRKSRSGGWMAWSSFTEASTDQCDYLRRQYIEKGLASLDQIGSKYAQDKNWSKKVAQYIPW